MSEAFPIESGVSIPERAAPNRKYPLPDMKVGENVFFTGGFEKAQSVRMAAGAFTKRNPEYRFTVRTVEGGFRCWRIEKKGST